MLPLSPPLLVAAAGALVGLGAESETSRGRLLDAMFFGVGQPNQGPWSAAFVHHVGYWSHYHFGGYHSSWPLPATNDPRDLDAFGQERNIRADDPEVGDVYLLWSPARKQHGRAGIVVHVEQRVAYRARRRTRWVCTTIEGETTERGGQSGRGIHVVRRTLSPADGDRILRWPSLDARGAAADPAAATTQEAGRTILRRAS